MNQNANRQVAFRAREAARQRRGLMAVDLGGGGGRVGTRERPMDRPTKSDLLRPYIGKEND